MGQTTKFAEVFTQEEWVAMGGSLDPIAWYESGPDGTYACAVQGDGSVDVKAPDGSISRRQSRHDLPPEHRVID